MTKQEYLDWLEGQIKHVEEIRASGDATERGFLKHVYHTFKFCLRKAHELND